MRRALVWTLALLLTLGGAAMAATAMGLKVNGTTLTLAHAPEYRDGVLMVPAGDVAKALGVDIKVDVQTNMVEITDNRTAKIAELDAKVKGLEAKLAPPPAPAVTTDNLIQTLNQKFGTFQKGTRSFSVTWSSFTATTGEQLFRAEFTPGSYLQYLYIAAYEDRSPVMDWFKQAIALIQTVHGAKFGATLVSYDTWSSYPSGRYDRVDLGSDYKWHSTDYIIWAVTLNGNIDVSWDKD